MRIGVRAGGAAVLCAMVLASCATDDRPAPHPEESLSAPLPGKLVREIPRAPERFPVLGADGGTVERLFGPPSLRRREPPAEYWRYDFARCTLDLFLFRAPEDPAPRVVYFELRERAPAAALQDCREIEARLDLPAPRRRPVELESH